MDEVKAYDNFNITEYDNSTINIGENSTQNFSDCSECTNDMCWPTEDYEMYLEWISVSNFEIVLVILHIVQILAGIFGNLLVSYKKHTFDIYILGIRFTVSTHLICN